MGCDSFSSVIDLRALIDNHRLIDLPFSDDRLTCYEQLLDLGISVRKQ